MGDDYLGDNPFDKFLYVEEAENWEDFLAWCKPLMGGWGFRGQSDSRWNLNPAINRSLFVSGEISGFSFGQKLDIRSYEERLLFRFKQEAHQYSQHLPEDADLMGWLALMQHHGTPTRLLDWTWSPYVAAYFAFEDDTDKAAIWAVDLDWLEHRGNRILQEKDGERIPVNPTERAAYLNKLLALRGDEEDQNKAPRMVVRVEPSKTDAWMTSQRGFFLCKCWDYPSMNQLLMRMMTFPKLVSTPKIRKLEIGGDLRFEFLKQLQFANIHRGSLFPGLDGFARSLSVDLQIQMNQMRIEMEEQAERQRYHSTSLAQEDDSED